MLLANTFFINCGNLIFKLLAAKQYRSCGNLTPQCDFISGNCMEFFARATSVVT